VNMPAERRPPNHFYSGQLNADIGAVWADVHELGLGDLVPASGRVFIQRFLFEWPPY
jgi:hypothetical protein